MVRRGFGLIEILLVIAVVLVALPAITQLTAATVRGVDESRRQVEATYLAEEGLDAVRAMRDQSWSSNIATPPGTCLTIVGSAWTLTATSPCVVDGTRYSRTVTFSDVYRDAGGAIAGSGTVDPHTKQVTATVSWTSRGTSKQVSLQTYLADYLAN